MDDDVYVLGTGASLLALSAEERAYLNAHSRTLALNRFFMHYEKLGIVPRMLFVADFNYYADLILRATLERLNAERRAIPFYINRDYLRLYRSPWHRHRRFKHRARRIFRRRFNYRPPAGLADYAQLVGFDATNESPTFAWARELGTPLYHRRGSLSTALNLVNILYPKRSVKLLGIDLSSPGYFYDAAITPANRDQWVDDKYERSLQTGSHANARPKPHDRVTLTEVMGWIAAEFRRQGLAIENCNPDSLLVREGITPAAPVIGRP